MTGSEEQAYEQGSRMAWVQVLGLCLKRLGVEDPDAQRAAWVAERTLAVSALRDICAEHGDNDWPDNLHLANVLEKHLGRYLEG